MVDQSLSTDHALLMSQSRMSRPLAYRELVSCCCLQRSCDAILCSCNWDNSIIVKCNRPILCSLAMDQLVFNLADCDHIW